MGTTTIASPATNTCLEPSGRHCAIRITMAEERSKAGGALLPFNLKQPVTYFCGRKRVARMFMPCGMVPLATVNGQFDQRSGGDQLGLLCQQTGTGARINKNNLSRAIGTACAAHAPARVFAFAASGTRIALVHRKRSGGAGNGRYIRNNIEIWRNERQ